MSEEAHLPQEEAQSHAPKPAVKRGRKAGKPKKVAPLAKGQAIAVHEDSKAKVDQTAVNKGYPSGRAVKIKVFQAEGEGEEVILKFGDAPFLRIRRGVEVIVPFEIISVLDDTVVQIPRTKWVDGKPVGEFYETVTRFPYTNLGEVAWSEYMKFVEGEKKKPMRATN